MNNFELKVKGSYSVSFQNDKVLKILVNYQDIKGKVKKIIMTYFPNKKNDLVEKLLELEGALVEIDSNCGYFTSRKLEDEWITESTLIINNVTEISLVGQQSLF